MATEHKPLIGKVLSLKNHLQRVSTFHRDSVIKGNVGDDVLYKAFMSVYWIAKQEIPKCKPVPLLQLLGKSDVTEMKHFTHKSAGCVREHFLTLGQVIIEQLLEKVHRSIFFGLLCDDVTDIAALEQFISFIQFVDPILTRFAGTFSLLRMLWPTASQQIPGPCLLFWPQSCKNWGYQQRNAPVLFVMAQVWCWEPDLDLLLD